MLRVLFMHHVSEIGGASYCLLSILKALDRNKIVPTVALASDGPLKKEIEALGIQVLLFNAMISAPYCRPLFHPSTIKRYIRVIKSQNYFNSFLSQIKDQFDVVYLNNLMLWHYLPIAKQNGLKTIVHIREHWPVNKRKIQFSWAKRNVLDYADQIVAINRFSASLVKDASYRTTIVYDWIDFSDRYKFVSFNDIFDSNSRKLKIFLFMGGNQKIKGTAEVMESFHNVISDPEARLLAMGTKPMVIKKTLINRIKMLLSYVGYNFYPIRINKALESDKRITCIENTYQIQHILQQVYCYVSYFTIPHANLALAECITQQTVSIAARTPESEEYSDDGKLAFLFDINNKKAFESMLSKIEDKYEEMKYRLGKGSGKIVELFDPVRNMRELDNVFDRLIIKEDNN